MNPPSSNSDLGTHAKFAAIGELRGRVVEDNRTVYSGQEILSSLDLSEKKKLYDLLKKDMGFIPDIERICKLLPFTRQTLFFSATMPPGVRLGASARRRRGSPV